MRKAVVCGAVVCGCLAAAWSIGAGLTRDRIQSSSRNGLWSSWGLTYHLGASLKARFGPTKLAAVASYGWDETNASRRGPLLADSVAEVERNMELFNLTLRGQHDFELENWFFRPVLDVGVTRLRTETAAESGGGGASLVFEDYTETHTWVRPAIAVGTEFPISSDLDLRLSLDFGALQYLDDTSTEVKARFSGLPADIEPLSISTDLGDPRYSGSIGLDLVGENNVVLQIYYHRAWSDDRDSESIILKVELPL